MSKKVITTLAALTTAAVAAISTPALVSAYGDNSGIKGGRPVYKIADINKGVLGNKVVFNSITDSVIGDERNFVAAQDVNTTNKTDWYGNEIKVENGKEYTIRLYVHNNNPKGKEVVAKNTKVAVSIPHTSAKKVEVNGFISSSNATPSEYWDYVNFVSENNAFHLEYVYGSALIYNNVLKNVKLDDSIVTAASKGGVTIGYDKLDGNIPGCYGYASYVTIRVKAVFDTDYMVEKKVRLEGTKEWKKNVDAKVGDRVEFQIQYKNTSSVNETQKNVMIKDVLPKNLKYVNNSTKLWNDTLTGAYVGTTGDPNGDGIVTNGINIGDYAPGANAYVRFTAEVVDDSLSCGSNVLTNWGQAGVGRITMQDAATVSLNKTCEKDPEPTPPKELPDTGPEAFVGGAIATGSIVTAAGYYIASRRNLR